MAHQAPAPDPTPARDARSRALRTLLQGVAVTVIVGAATAVAQAATDGSVLTLATVVTAACTGAGMALAAWVQRRLEGIGK